MLLVEDEFLLALTLEGDLRDAGYAVIGPYQELLSGLAAADREAFDVAILDVNLNGIMVFPLAERLLERQIPFMFLTGYSAVNLPHHLRDVPRVPKPYDGAVLLRALAAL